MVIDDLNDADIRHGFHVDAAVFFKWQGVMFKYETEAIFAGNIDSPLPLPISCK